MKTCAKCNKEIDLLRVVRTLIMQCYMLSDGRLHDWEPEEEDDDEYEFFCLECGALLFDSEFQARAFMTNKKLRKAQPLVR
jgi:hypothetical protein